MLIRPEQPSDHQDIFELNASVFDSPSEARLVDCLREQCDQFISLVAEKGGDIVGNIVFSPVTLAGDTSSIIFGLGPMAVAPSHQRQGIGTALVRAGLEHCRALGAEAIVVLGHPAYYPRFGFLPASGFGIDSDFPAPDEAFMAVELQAGALGNKSGRVKYHRAFSDA